MWVRLGARGDGVFVPLEAVGGPGPAQQGGGLPGLGVGEEDCGEFWDF